MKLIIDIPEETYNAVIGDEWIDSEYIYNIINSIQNGTQLPKGHGRLKDVDKIISDGRSKGFCDWYDEMKYADTIIEADKPKKKSSTPLEENDSGYNCENWIP